MRKVKKLAAVIVLILLAFVYGHVHKTHAIYDRMIENDQYVMMNVSQDQISQEFVCEEETLDGIQVKCQNLQEDPETEIIPKAVPLPLRLMAIGVRTSLNCYLKTVC